MDRARLDDSYRRALAARRPRRPAPGRIDITIVALVDGRTDAGALLRSCERQTLTGWTLWLVCADGGGRAQAAAAAAASTLAAGRVRVTTAADLCGSADAWLPPGDTEYVLLLDGRTRLSGDGLASIHEAISGVNPPDWIYTDDDRCDESGRRHDPCLKGAFAPALAILDDQASRLAVVRRTAIASLGGCRPAYGSSQLSALLFRAQAAGIRISHCGADCAHHDRRDRDLDATERWRAADDHLGGRGVVVIDRTRVAGTPIPRVRWTATGRGPAVTVIIPTRDRLELLVRCIDSLRHTVDWTRTQLLVVDDDSEQPETRGYFRQLTSAGGLPCRVLTVLRRGRPFNYAALMNQAAAEVTTPLVLHLNNDVRALEPGWIDQMAGWLEFADVGVVGCRLIHEDGSLQHGGVIVSPAGGALEHFQKWLVTGDPGYQRLPYLARDVSAVTGACLLTRSALLRDLDGFDEQNFAVQFNDVDFCLRAREAGWRVVYEGAVGLEHRAGATRGGTFDFTETLRFLNKYRTYRDPFISARLDPVSVCGPSPVLRSR
jgi:GT2 family glycosyltransferase